MSSTYDILVNEYKLLYFNIVSHQSNGMPDIMNTVVDYRVYPEWSRITPGNLDTADKIKFFRHFYNFKSRNPINLHYINFMQVELT